ncbi:MAG: hypothetical protein LOY00_07225 [Methylocaldum sp.]|nr:hypothetical protein [Methylocaldum sp.]
MIRQNPPTIDRIIGAWGNPALIEYAPAISGLYYVIRDIAQRVQKAGELIKGLRDSERELAACRS